LAGRTREEQEAAGGKFEKVQRVQERQATAAVGDQPGIIMVAVPPAAVYLLPTCRAHQHGTAYNRV
jgi:hypothetical protein